MATFLLYVEDPAPAFPRKAMMAQVDPSQTWTLGLCPETEARLKLENGGMRGLMQ